MMCDHEVIKVPFSIEGKIVNAMPGYGKALQQAIDFQYLR